MENLLTKRAYYLNSAILVYGAMLLVILIAFLYMTDLASDEGLFDRLAPLITSVTVVLAPFVYFLKTKHSEYSERTRASRNLYTELNNTLDALDEKSYPDSFSVVEFEGTFRPHGRGAAGGYRAYAIPHTNPTVGHRGFGHVLGTCIISTAATAPKCATTGSQCRKTRNATPVTNNLS